MYMRLARRPPADGDSLRCHSLHVVNGASTHHRKTNPDTSQRPLLPPAPRLFLQLLSLLTNRSTRTRRILFARSRDHIKHALGVLNRSSQDTDAIE